MEKIFWFYDALTVGIILIFLYVGAKRGLLRSIVYTALIVLSFLGSWFVSEAAAPYIYDSFIKEHVSEGLYQNAQRLNPAAIVSQSVSGGDYGVEITEDEISGIIDRDADFFDELAKEMRKNGSPDSADEIASSVRDSVAPKLIGSLIDDAVASDYVSNALGIVGGAAENITQVVTTLIVGTSEDIARTAEQNIIAPTVVWLLKAVIFILLMILFRFIIKPVANAFKLVNKIPVIGSVNSLLGAVLGFAEGLVFLYVMAVAIKAVIGISGNSLIFFNTDTVERSKLFVKIYSFDILSLIKR